MGDRYGEHIRAHQRSSTLDQVLPGSEFCGTRHSDLYHVLGTCCGFLRTPRNVAERSRVQLYNYPKWVAAWIGPYCDAYHRIFVRLQFKFVYNVQISLRFWSYPPTKLIV